jgi:hypothetical protein
VGSLCARSPQGTLLAAPALLAKIYRVTQRGRVADWLAVAVTVRVRVRVADWLAVVVAVRVRARVTEAYPKHIVQTPVEELEWLFNNAGGAMGSMTVCGVRSGEGGGVHSRGRQSKAGKQGLQREARPCAL